MSINDDDEITEPGHIEASNSGAKKTIEAWAEQKGMLPELVSVPARLGSRDVQAKRQNPKFVLYTTAKAHRRWPEGKEVTEAEFDAAVAESGAVGLR